MASLGRVIDEERGGVLLHSILSYFTPAGFMYIHADRFSATKLAEVEQYYIMLIIRFTNRRVTIKRM